jgi:hypothetical protein
MCLDVVLPAALIAGRRLAWPDIAARLLPVLLPGRASWARQALDVWPGASPSEFPSVFILLFCRAAQDGSPPGSTPPGSGCFCG